MEPQTKNQSYVQREQVGEFSCEMEKGRGKRDRNKDKTRKEEVSTKSLTKQIPPSY